MSAPRFNARHDPPRLRELLGSSTERARAAEGRASALLCQVGEPVTPSAVALEHLERSLEARIRSHDGWAGGWLPRSRPRSWAIGLLALVSSAGAATWLAVRPAPSIEMADVTSQPEARAAVSTEPASEPRELREPRQPREIVEPVHPAVQAPRGIARHFAGSRDHTHAQADPPSPALAIAPPDAEAALVARALHELREEKNPRAALDTLDEHTQRFPGGRLLHEAGVARLEALTATGQRKQALAALEGGLPALAPLGRSALVLRGELRASAGRLGGAREDFEAAWAYGAKDDLAARALLGLARVQLSLGARALAEKNLHQYLEVFPHAASASEARKALGQR